MSLTRFRTLGPPAPDIAELLPAKLQGEGEGALLNLVSDAIAAGIGLFSVRRLPMGRWEVRMRDAAWLARQEVRT